MTQQRGIGIVGLGGIAQNHLAAYRKRGFNVVAGQDVNPAIFETIRTKFGVERLTTNLDEFLATPGLEIVDLAVPHYLELRQPIVEAVAKAGKALFCQKPLDESFAGALTLTRIVEKAGIKFAVNQNAPFVPGFQAAAAFIRDPEKVGKPYYFQVENRGALWFERHAHWGTRDRWILDGMAVHHLALAHAWFGVPSRVWASLAKDPTKPGIRAENIAVVGLEYPSGLRGLVINNWSYTGPRSRSHPREEIIVLGDHGSVTFDSKELTFSAPGREPQTVATAGEWFDDAFGESMGAFLRSFDGGPSHPSAGREDLKVMAVVEAAYGAAESGRAISPDEYLKEAA